MLFTNFLLSSLARLEKATHGYGRCLSERALYETLTEQGMPIDEFLVLMQWGVLSGLLTEHDSDSGRRYLVNRKAMAALRSRANGESGQLPDDPTTCHFQRAQPGASDLPSEPGT